MPKIITITPNTAIDIFIEVEGLALKDNIQANNSYEFACGKGVNVAKAVAAQGWPALCLGFVGRQSLGLFEAIDVAGLQTDFTAVEGKTRSNITLFDSAENKETHIRTSGFTVTAGDCRNLSEKIAATVAAGDVVIFSGSLPPGAPDDLYRELIELCHSQGARTFLDSSGRGLSEGLKAKPYLIKPNQQEFAELTGLTSTAEADIVATARCIIAQGVEWVYVSFGAQGVIAVGKNAALSACMSKVPGNIRSHVGCGDAMLAGLAVAMLQGFEVQEVVKTGVACGTANLFSIEPGRLEKALLADILPDVEVRWL